MALYGDATSERAVAAGVPVQIHTVFMGEPWEEPGVTVTDAIDGARALTNPHCDP